MGKIIGIMAGCGVAGNSSSVGCEGGENSIVVDAGEDAGETGEPGDVGRMCCLGGYFLGGR